MSDRPNSRVPAWARYFAVGAMCALLGSSLAGCGKKSGGSEAEAAAEEGATEETHHAASSGKSTSPKSSKGKEKVVYIGDIPKDVWFDDPLTTASDKTPIGGAPKQTAAPTVAATNAPAPEPATKAAAEPAPPAGGGKDDWKSIIPGEILVDETKKIKNRLTDGLSSVTRYNGNYKDLQVDGAVLAALAGIEATHPDPVSWKADAKYVRDLGSDIAAKSKGLGQGSYDPTKQAFEKLDGVLGGNKPGDLGDAAATVPFSEVARRQLLMKRMERAFNAMKSNINNEDIFKKSGETVIHEATMLATLAKVVGSEGYDAADEPDYQNFIKEIVTSNLAVAAAAKNGDYKAYNDGLSRCFKACNDCHASYKNN